MKMLLYLVAVFAFFCGSSDGMDVNPIPEIDSDTQNTFIELLRSDSPCWIIRGSIKNIDDNQQDRLLIYLAGETEPPCFMVNSSMDNFADLKQLLWKAFKAASPVTLKTLVKNPTFWTPRQSYDQGFVIVYDRKTYTCLENHRASNVNRPGSNGGTWLAEHSDVPLRWAQEAFIIDVVSTSFEEWSSKKRFGVGFHVKHKNKTYECKKQHVSGTIFDREYWEDCDELYNNTQLTNDELLRRKKRD